jgi:dimethylargininase
LAAINQPTLTRSKALVRRPGPRLAEGIVTHVERMAVDTGLAVRQWERYCRAMVSAGWNLLEGCVTCLSVRLRP